MTDRGPRSRKGCRESTRVRPFVRIVRVLSFRLLSVIVTSGEFSCSDHFGDHFADRGLQRAEAAALDTLNKLKSLPLVSTSNVTPYHVLH